MPIDWIDVKSKYGLDPKSSEVKTIADKYDKDLAKFAKESDGNAKKIETEKDAKKKKLLEDGLRKAYQAGLIHMRKEAETALDKIKKK